MYLFLALAFGYVLLIVVYERAWQNIPESDAPENFQPETLLTVLVPARNEAENIGECLDSILACDFPHTLLEIIVLDDFSEDRTTEIVLEKARLYPNISLIRLAKTLSPEARQTPNKKKAIELGVNVARGALIAATDADCVVAGGWLRQIAYAFSDPGVNMVCGPVAFHREKNLLQRFQSLDFLGMMGITGAGIRLSRHYMANGANLAYRKRVFENQDVYDGNASIPSGDDMFLAQKVAQNGPGSVVFLKTMRACVWTEAMPDLSSFWAQRLRWGSKNAAFPDWGLRLSLLLVFLFCWSILIGAGLVLAGWGGAFTLLGAVTLKAAADYFLLSRMAIFFGRKDLMRSFLPSFFLHTLYIAVLGLAGLVFKKYRWKGRAAY